MSENKDYISRADELGNIHIAEEVLAAVAAAAAMEVKGVSAMAANFGTDIAELLGKKNQAKGVRIQVEEDKVSVELAIMMAYGNTIHEVGKAVQENVKTTMESVTGLEIAAVNVSVAGIVFPPKQA
ncbi:MAG: Asp23/Gls24 family envelope stress response protein [Clostridium sp.]|nr:Asp23/Gls24 family envelope stress response protein [Clostridium sp.]